MKDIAVEAKVSLTTVSDVLNNKGRVDAKTRAHVREVASSLDFTPNRAARGLASSRTFVIGLSLPSIAALRPSEIHARDWYGRIIVAASLRAMEHQNAIAVLPALASADDLHRYPVDGLVVIDPVEDDPRLRLLEGSGMTYVSVGRDPEHPGVPYVAPDTRAGMTELFSHLEEQGARRVLMLASPVRWSSVSEAIDVAREWTNDKRLAISHRVVGAGQDPDPGRLYDAVREEARTALLEASPPDAIVGLFEGFGTSILMGALAAGQNVPADVLVAQDIDAASTMAVAPAITALDLHPELQAESAVDLLLDRLGPQSLATGITTPVTLRARKSTAKRNN